MNGWKTIIFWIIINERIKKLLIISFSNYFFWFIRENIWINFEFVYLNSIKIVRLYWLIGCFVLNFLLSHDRTNVVRIWVKRSIAIEFSIAMLSLARSTAKTTAIEMVIAFNLKYGLREKNVLRRCMTYFSIESFAVWYLSLNLFDCARSIYCSSASSNSNCSLVRI